MMRTYFYSINFCPRPLRAHLGSVSLLILSPPDLRVLLSVTLYSGHVGSTRSQDRLSHSHSPCRAAGLESGTLPFLLSPCFSSPSACLFFLSLSLFSFFLFFFFIRLPVTCQIRCLLPVLSGIHLCSSIFAALSIYIIRFFCFRHLSFGVASSVDYPIHFLSSLSFPLSLLFLRFILIFLVLFRFQCLLSSLPVFLPKYALGAQV